MEASLKYQNKSRNKRPMLSVKQCIALLYLHWEPPNSPFWPINNCFSLLFLWMPHQHLSGRQIWVEELLASSLRWKYNEDFLLTKTKLHNITFSEHQEAQPHYSEHCVRFSHEILPSPSSPYKKGWDRHESPVSPITLMYFFHKIDTSTMSRPETGAWFQLPAFYVTMDIPLQI